MRDNHALELNQLLTHIARIKNDNRLTQHRDRFEQFGEFCRSLLSYIQLYLKPEDNEQLEAFVKQLFELEALISPAGEFVDHTASYADFNASIARELAFSFPSLANFKTSADFDSFLDAFASVPREPEQLKRFTNLKTRAAALIVSSAAGAAGGARLGAGAEIRAGAGTGLVDKIKVPAPSTLARLSPVDAVARRLSFSAAVAISSLETFNRDLQDELGVRLVKEAETPFFSNLRIENFTDQASLEAFLNVAFGAQAKERIATCQKNSAITLDELFTLIYRERRATNIIRGKVVALKEALLSLTARASAAGVSSVLAQPHFDETHIVLSEYVQSTGGFSIARFSSVTNMLLKLGYHLSLLAAEYEEIQIKYEVEMGDLARTKSTGVSAVRSREPVLLLISMGKEKLKAFVALQDGYYAWFAELEYVLSVLLKDGHAIIKAEKLAELKLAVKSFCEKAGKTRIQLIEMIRDAVRKPESFYYYNIKTLLDELGYAEERSASLASIASLLMEVQKEQQQIAIAKLKGSLADVVGQLAASVEAVPLDEDPIVSIKEPETLPGFYRKNSRQLLLPLGAPSPCLSVSRSQRITPITVSAELHSEFEGAAESLASVHPNIAIGRLGERGAALKSKLGEAEAVTAYVNYLDHPGVDGERIPRTLPSFVPLCLKPSMVRRIQLQSYLQSMTEKGHSPSFSLGKVYVTEGHLVDQMIHVVAAGQIKMQVPREESLDFAGHLKIILLNYFRVIEEFRQSTTDQARKVLILPIFALAEAIAPGYSNEDQEIGAYLALIAVMMYRNYVKFPNLTIKLLCHPYLSAQTKLVVETSLKQEWHSQLILKILRLLSDIDRSEKRILKIAPTVEAILRGTVLNYFLDGLSKKPAKTSTALRRSVSIAPGSASLSWGQYCEWGEARDDVVLARRLESFQAIWAKNGKDELAHYKLKRLFQSYNDWSLWKHHRRRVNEFVSKLLVDLRKKEIYESKHNIWNKDQITKELGNLMLLCCQDYAAYSPSYFDPYTPEQFFRGHLCMLVLVAMRGISLMPEPVVANHAVAGTAGKGLRASAAPTGPAEVGLRVEVSAGAAGTGLVLGVPRASDLTAAPLPALNTGVGFGGNVAEIGGERKNVVSGAGVFRNPTHALTPPSSTGITGPRARTVVAVLGVVPVGDETGGSLYEIV